MKILITGANGFIGKNLISELHNRDYQDLLLVDRDTTEKELEKYSLEADFVFHLAGVNRPKEEIEFTQGNVDFTDRLLSNLKKSNKKAPIMISSSTQAVLDNSYGISKRAGEQLIFDYAEETGVRSLVYRFPNVFGKWSKPNYNSAIATFCYNISRNLDITVNDPSVMLELVYIDDVVNELINGLTGKESRENNYCFVPTTHRQSLGWIVETIKSFKESRENLVLPNVEMS